MTRCRVTTKTTLKVSVTVVAAIGIVVHLIWPQVRIDAITLGLLVVSVLPWLSAFVKSAEFPGGWKITFHDIAAAGAKVTGASQMPKGSATATSVGNGARLQPVGQDSTRRLLLSLEVSWAA